jgi:hypothetical protein
MFWPQSQSGARYSNKGMGAVRWRGGLISNDWAAQAAPLDNLKSELVTGSNP